MNPELIQKLKYSVTGRNDAHSFPLSLLDSLKLIHNYFSKNTNNKLCLVFPTKEYTAQWLSVPTVLSIIQSDFEKHQSEITESLEKYNKGDLIILNNTAIVEWVGKRGKELVFKHKEYNNVDKISIELKKISKVQPAPSSRKTLSPFKTVKEALIKTNINATDKILGIQTDGNRLFQKNSICLISKHISYENSISEISLNNFLINEYFKRSRIDETGEVDTPSPLLISNNLTNLALYVTMSDTVSKIIIDGYSAIHERKVDFNDIDVKQIPTILITDLSEIESFEDISECGFDFFNFTRENLNLNEIESFSPFSSFDKKLHRYVSFNLHKEICIDLELEDLTRLIHSIDKDESVKELVILKILLVQLTNLVSRIVHPLNKAEITVYSGMIERIRTLFWESRFYLGGFLKAIEDSISSLQSIVNKLETKPSNKCIKLSELLQKNSYDYIICPTEEEALSLSLYLSSQSLWDKPKVISLTEVDNSLLERKHVKAILTGWAKSNNVNRLLSSFLFSELTVLFYQFESRYFNSLQNRNKRLTSNAGSTVNREGNLSGKETGVAFSNFYENDASNSSSDDATFDINEFELKLDDAQFSKYIIKGNAQESIKAKRVEFKNDKFIYVTETHGLLVLDNYYRVSDKPLSIVKNRIENLHRGDIIVFLKTERELLNNVVEKQTTPSALAETTKWIELWKELLRGCYRLMNGNFSAFAAELKKNGCDRDPATIRSWLFDDLKIGPRSDNDLIAIAILANSTELSDNIAKVRKSIKQMTSWRMKAGDYLIGQLKSKIKDAPSSIQVNSIVDFEDLGEVEILEILEVKNSYDHVDIRNANRLLEKNSI